MPPHPTCSPDFHKKVPMNMLVGSTSYSPKSQGNCTNRKKPPRRKKPEIIKLKTTHKFIESQAAKAVVGQTIY